MKKHLYSNSSSIVLIFLFLLAATLRLYGIWYPRWAFDEAENFGGGLNIIKFFLNSLNLANEPYTDELWVYGLVGKYISILPVAVGFVIEKFVPSSSPIPLALVFTRFTVAALPSILVVYFLYHISILLKTPKSFKIILLALCCCTFKHIETAHYAVSESLSAFWLVSSIYYWLKFQIGDYSETKYLKISTLLVALAASTKINVGMILGITLALSTLLPYLQQQFDFQRLLKYTKVLIAYFFVPFIVINLPYFLHFSTWLAIIQVHLENYPYIAKGSFGSLFYGDPIFGVDWGIFIIACGGLLWSIYRRKYIYAAPALFIILFYLYLSLSLGIVHRWVIPMSPFLALFATYFLNNLYQYLHQKIQQKAAIIAIGLLVLIIGSRPFYHAILYNLNLTHQPNTYTLAKQYITDNQISEKKTIGCYIGINFPNIQTKAPPSIADFKENEFDYAIFTDFWFWQRRFPQSILNQHFVEGRSGGNWEPIRQYVEQNWQLEKQIAPKYLSTWSTNVASPPIFYIYKKPKY